MGRNSSSQNHGFLTLTETKDSEKRLSISEVFLSTVLKLHTPGLACTALILCYQSSLESQNLSGASGTVHSAPAVLLEFSPKRPLQLCTHCGCDSNL